MSLCCKMLGKKNWRSKTNYFHCFELSQSLYVVKCLETLESKIFWSQERGTKIWYVFAAWISSFQRLIPKTNLFFMTMSKHNSFWIVLTFGFSISDVKSPWKCIIVPFILHLSEPPDVLKLQSSDSNRNGIIIANNWLCVKAFNSRHDLFMISLVSRPSFFDFM